MSRNGSGVYSLPAGNPVVTGTTISSTWANTTLSDIATALTGSVAADGQTAMTGNLQMGSNKITGLGVATTSGDALSFGQAATISALTVSGAFAANGGATLGDASGDALTINSNAVSIPNGLSFSGGNVSIANNLAFTGTGNRITGDFSNATLANRVMFQTSTTNSSTVVQAIPNGTGTTSGYRLFNSNDSANSSTGEMVLSSALFNINSGNIGTGSYLPMTFQTGGSERLRIDTSGNVGIGTSSAAARLQVNAATTTTPSLTYGTTSGQIFRNENSELAIGLSSTAPYPLYLQGRQSTNVAREIVFNPVGGNVGVGVTTTGGLLDVGGVFKIQNNGDVYGVSGNTGALLFCGGSAYDAGGSIKLYGSSNGDMITFQTGAFAERMRITSAGNVGIGLTNPNTELHVQGAPTTDGSIVFNQQLTATTAFNSSPQSGTMVSLKYNTGGDYAGLGGWSVIKENATDGNFAGAMLFHSRANGGAITERMRITSGGNFLVGRTGTDVGTNGCRLDPNGSSFFSISNAGDSLAVYNINAAAYRFYVNAAGTVFATNTTISAISDQRFKENVQDLDVGLDAVLALKPRKFDWKEGQGKNIQGDRGFIAQEFETVFPDLVDEWKDPSPDGEEPYKSIRADLIPILVKAIQEQQAIINDLKARIETLESK
jgi:hypothetical protein